MMEEVKVSSVAKKLMIFCLMLFAVDAFGLGWYIFGVAFLFAILFLAFSGKGIKINFLLVLVILLAVSNFFIIYFHSRANLFIYFIKYLVSPICGLFIGQIVARYRGNKDNIVKLYMYAVIPYFIHGVLNLLVFRGFSGYEREVADFWTGEMWKATLACTYFVMTAPLGFMAFITKGFLKKLACVFLTVTSIFASIITASRTVIFIAVIVVIFEMFLYLKEKPLSKSRGSLSLGQWKIPLMSSRMYFVIQLLIVGAVAIVMLVQNMDALLDSDFFKRLTLDLSEEPRIQLFLNVILNTWEYPFGNMPYFYSHNTWLDFLRRSGWITFVLFAIITFIVVKDIVLIYKNKNIDQNHRIAVVAMMTALMLDMFVEPMMDGAAILFCLFFYFIGINNHFAKKAMWRI